MECAVGTRNFLIQKAAHRLMKIGAVEVAMVLVGVVCLVTIATSKDKLKLDQALARGWMQRYEARLPYRK